MNKGMMDDMDDMGDTGGMGGESQEDGATPIDEIIARVQSYIENPAMVTAKTLKELKSELEDLKSVLDGEDMGDGDEKENSHGNPLMITIGRLKNKKESGGGY